MRLGEIIPQTRPAAAAVEIADLAYDTRQVRPGTLFFCVPGFTRDGHEFAPQAVADGAVALVVERHLDGVEVPQVRVESVRAAMAPAAAAFFADPTAALETVGVTGTNGKTTTAFLVRALLEAAGRQTGLLGTVKSVVGGAEAEVERTTPEAIDLQRTFARMLGGRRPGGGDRGLQPRPRASPRRRDPLRRCDLHQPDPGPSRLPPDDGGLLPGQARLFTDLAPACAIVNIDDPYGARLAGELADPITFALEDRAADYLASDLETGLSGSRFTLRAPDGRHAVSSPLTGRFNVLNVARRVRRGARARRCGRDVRGGDPHRRPGSRALPGGRRGPAVRGARRLRPHSGLAGERAARRPRPHRRPGARRVRRRRRPRPRASGRRWGRSPRGWPTG